MRADSEKKEKFFSQYTNFLRRNGAQTPPRGAVHMLRYLLGGAGIGAANGLFGGGGGMIAVPVLKSAGRSAHEAHAAALAVILPASLVSAAVYLLHGLIPFSVFLPVALGVLFGGAAGARLLPRISARAVTLIFAAFMLAAGVRMIF